MKNRIELIRGCRAGKDSACREFYTLYSRQLLVVYLRYMGDMEAARGILYDGFIKMFTSFSLRGESSLGIWVTRVMMTRVLDYLRRQKRISQLMMHEDQLLDIPDLPEGREAGPAPEEQLMKLVTDLPGGCQMVFNLYVLEEKSYKEIADVLGIKECSSTSQLHRAKFLLAKGIKEYRNHGEGK